MLLTGHVLWWMAQPGDERPVSTAGEYQRRLEAAQMVGSAGPFVEGWLDEQFHTQQV